MIRRTLTTWLALVAAVALVCGCGAKHGKLVAVEGKVTLKDGKPLPKGTKLYFHPASGKMGSAIGIVTGVDGSFQVKHETGTTGAAPGKYTVQLAAPENDQAFFKSIPKEYYEGTGNMMAEVKDPMNPLKLQVLNK